MMRRSVRLLAVGLALSCCLSGPVSAQVPPYGPIPPPRAEVVPPPPGARYIWQPGHWFWNGRAYAWIPGRYIIRQAHYREYVPGHWDRRGPNWVWIPAHWR